MKNITYLLGAGASANCLPVVEKIPDGLKKVIIYLKDSRFQLSGYFNGINISQEDLRLNMIADLEWIHAECSRHSSIDTLAKKFYLTKRIFDLYKLKFGLCVYLAIEQIINPLDKRYDSFFASILNDNSYNFPPNINILTWNYDNHFELSFSEYAEQKESDYLQATLGSISKYDETRYKKGLFEIFRLNGSIGYYVDGERFYRPFIDFRVKHITASVIENLVYLYSIGLNSNWVANKIKPGISFAWEDENSINRLYSKISQAVAETDILIIIGYSFPFFNRSIDKQILDSIKKGGLKVYFQGLEPEDVLFSRFKNATSRIFPDSDMVKIQDLKQFYLPPEL